MEIQITNKVLDKVFFNDGSLRDIYVLEGDLSDWQKFYDWIRTSPWKILFYKDGKITAYEEKDVAKIFDEKENGGIHLMSIDIKGVLINCHFFSVDELEFDIEPKKVKNVSQAIGVFGFMIKLSKILGKESILTLENCPEKPLVIVKSDGNLITNI